MAKKKYMSIEQFYNLYSVTDMALYNGRQNSQYFDEDRRLNAAFILDRYEFNLKIRRICIDRYFEMSENSSVLSVCKHLHKKSNVSIAAWRAFLNISLFSNPRTVMSYKISKNMWLFYSLTKGKQYD